MSDDRPNEALVARVLAKVAAAEAVMALPEPDAASSPPPTRRQPKRPPIQPVNRAR